MLLDYLQEMRLKYSNEEQLPLQRLEQQPNLGRAEKTAANKRLEEVRARRRELKVYHLGENMLIAMDINYNMASTAVKKILKFC